MATANNSDDEFLARQLGYKPVLYRGLDVLMLISIGISNVSPYLSIAGVLTYGLTVGGPGPMTWGWIIGSFFTIVTSLVLAEICSSYPQAGSVYFWSSRLASPAYAPWLAYWTGLFNWLNNVAGDASWAFVVAIFVSSSFQILGYSALSTGALVGISIFVLMIWGILNTLRIDHVGWLGNFSSVLQVATFIMFAAALLLFCPSYNSSSFVFFNYYNGTGYENRAYVLVISILTTVWGFAGIDANAHMAEESVAAQVSTPHSIIIAVISNAVLGFAFILVVLFCIQDYDTVINNSYDSAVIAILLENVSTGLAFAVVWVFIACLFFTGITSTSVTNRITFALLRDHILPGHGYLASTHPETKAPNYAMIVVVVADSLLLLLPLVSETAFYSLMAVCTVSFQLSLAIPITLKFLHEGRGSLIKGPVQFGALAYWLELLTLLWLYSTSTALLFPYSFPVTSSNMNYTGVVLAGFVVLGTIYWEVSLKYSFKGPQTVLHSTSDDEASDIGRNEGGRSSDRRIRENDEGVDSNNYVDKDAAGVSDENSPLIIRQSARQTSR